EQSIWSRLMATCVVTARSTSPARSRSPLTKFIRRLQFPLPSPPTIILPAAQCIPVQSTFLDREPHRYPSQPVERFPFTHLSSIKAEPSGRRSGRLISDGMEPEPRPSI